MEKIPKRAGDASVPGGDRCPWRRETRQTETGPLEPASALLLRDVGRRAIVQESCPGWGSLVSDSDEQRRHATHPLTFPWRYSIQSTFPAPIIHSSPKACSNSALVKAGGSRRTTTLRRVLDLAAEVWRAAGLTGITPAVPDCAFRVPPPAFRGDMLAGWYYKNWDMGRVARCELSQSRSEVMGCDVMLRSFSRCAHPGQRFARGCSRAATPQREGSIPPPTSIFES